MEIVLGDPPIIEPLPRALCVCPLPYCEARQRDSLCILTSLHIKSAYRIFNFFSGFLLCQSRIRDPSSTMPECCSKHMSRIGRHMRIRLSSILSPRILVKTRAPHPLSLSQ